MPLQLEILEQRHLLANVSWVDWIEGSPGTNGSATGTMTFEGTIVDVSYAGEIAFIQTAGGTDYWTPRTAASPYLSEVVSNPPPASDIIALSQAASKTLTFSEPVADLLFAVVSLNGNGYRFNRDFDILSYGAGYWGNGTLSKQDLGDGVYQLNGSGEPHGVIRFRGADSSITWTSLTNEYWNGFTVGAVSLAQPDLTITAGAVPPFAPGMARDLTWTVTNEGTLAATADWTDRVYLSTDATLSLDDVLLVAESVIDQTPLAPGTSYHVTRPIVVPPGTLPGNYHLLAVADADERQFETSEGNNVFALPIQIVAPPQVTAHEPSGHVPAADVAQMTLTLSRAVVGADARLAATYQLLDLGPDYQPGGGDDQPIRVEPSYLDGGSQIGLLFLGDGTIDLTQWTERDYGNGAAGDWRIEQGGASVKQYINGDPTYYVSDFDFIDRQFVGRIAVETTSDDDLIGLVFGFGTSATSKPDSYYLLSWKQAAQDVAERGFKLLKITNSGAQTESTMASAIWNGEDWTAGGAAMQVLVRNNTQGWADNTQYDFSVRYQSDGKIDVEIRRSSDQLLMWSYSLTDSAPLGTGKVGFFNYSQSDVRYSGLRQARFLEEGAYQLTAYSGEPGLRDGGGIPLDGNGNGSVESNDHFVSRLIIDLTPPEVLGVSIQNAAIVINYHDLGGIDPATVTDRTNYTLVASGGDGTFGEANDVLVDLATQLSAITFTTNAGGNSQALLSFSASLPDEIYRLTINGTGVRDLAGHPLSGGNHVTDLQLSTEPTLVTLDLQAASDSGASSTDNLTRDNTPAYDVVVNKAGKIEVDFNGDGTYDIAQTVPAAGVYAFTSTPLADGTYTPRVVFQPAAGLAAQHALDVTIDTQGPYVQVGAAHEQAPLYSRTVRFSEDIDVNSVVPVLVSMTGPGGGNVLLVSLSGSGDTFTLGFVPITVPGEYQIKGHIEIADLAGNYSDQNQNGINGEVGDDPRDTFTLLPDTTAPYITRFEPLGLINQDVQRFEVEFSEAMDAASFTAADVAVTGPSGALDPSAFSVAAISDRTFYVTVPLLTAEGTYDVSIGPVIRDLAGNTMAQLVVVDEQSFDTNPSSWTYYGDTAWNPGGFVRLTTANSNRRGAAYFGTPQTPAPFKVEFDFNLNNAGGLGGGADGLTFVVAQNAVLGDLGVGIGYSGALGTSFAVEFDTYYNGGVDPNNNHLALDWNGQFRPTAVPVNGPWMNNSGTHHAVIQFDGESLVTATLVGPQGHVTTLSGNVPANAVPTQYTFGFTSATGAGWANHDIDNVKLYLVPGGDDGVYRASFTIDKTGPAVTQMVFTGGTGPGLNTLDLTFDENIQAGSFGSQEVTLTAPGGALVPVSNPMFISGTTYRVTFAKQVISGEYAVTLGPNILDLAGNNMAAVFQGAFELALPDLRVTNARVVESPPSSSGPLTVRWDVLNDGASPLDRNFSTRLVVRNQDTGQTLLTADVPYDFSASGSIAPGAATPQERWFTLPDGPSGAGSLEITVTADTYQQVAEADPTGTAEANNTTAFTTTSQLSPYADLQVRDLVIAPAAGLLSGSPLMICWSVFNDGMASVNTPFRERVVIVNTGTGQTLIAATLFYDPAADGNAAIAPASGRPRTFAYTLPNGAAGAGTFQVTVTTDYVNELFEHNAGDTAESNNAAQTSFTSTLATYPDLVAENVSGPRYVLPGATVLVSWDTVNLGPSAASGDWTERVLLLNEASGSSTLVATFRFTGQALAATERVSRIDRAVRLPNGLATGQWRWLVRVDDESQVFEVEENNNSAPSALDVTVPVLLTLSAPRARISESDAPQTVRLSRSGNTAAAVTVTLESSDASELTVPASVVIPAGQSWIEFFMTPVQDALQDGDQTAVLTARVLDAGGAEDRRYAPTHLGVVVTDSAAPLLLQELSSAEVDEGSSVTATVTRDVTVFKSQQLVSLSAEGNNQLNLPATVTIPENAASVQFTVTAVPDELVEADRAYRLTAQGFGTGTASLLVRDTNRKDLIITTRDTAVSESAPGLATIGTVTRPVVTARSQVIALRSSDNSRLQVPAQVTIPANRASIEFPVTTVDNFVQGDNATVTIEAFCVDTVDLVTLVLPGGSASVLVQDNDSPTLTVTLDRGLISENAPPPAAQGTVRRNTLDNTQPLVVNLFSSDITEAIPGTATVTIPAHGSFAVFDIHAVDDFTPDGNQIVTISAEAAGFNAGSSRLVVSDVDKPDLRVTQVTPPARGYTDYTVELVYRVANEGRQPAAGPWVDRVYLSRDAWLDGNDQVLGSFPFTGTIPVGQSESRSVPVTWPSTVGSFYVIVATDVGFDVDEILETNNQGISDVLEIEAAYTVTVSTDVEQSVMGTSIPLSGVARLAGTDQPAASVPVVVRVVHEGGFVRTLQASTDESGQYAAVFTPLPNEAGDYRVSASHPGVASSPPQDNFTLIGMRVLPASTSHDVIVGQTVTQTMELKNLSGVDLTDVQFTVVGAPANLTVTVTPPAFDLVPGRQLRNFSYEISASDLSTTVAELTLRVTAAGGPTLDIPVSVRVKIAAGLLVGPPALEAGMLRGRLTPVEFEIRNDGGGETGPIEIQLPSAPWLRSASGSTIPSLAAGATTKVSLVLNPAVDQPLGPYSGNLVLRSDNSNPLSIPFTFTAVSDATGDLRITVVDESTYFAEGAPKVAGAKVSLVNAFTGAVIFTAETDATGSVTLNAIPEGPYELYVTAAEHDTSRGSVLIEPGKTNQQLVFLRSELVTYSWNVVPVPFEDRYTVVIESQFQTNVPAPVIVVDPMLIDLAEITDGYEQIDFKVSNLGLIAATDVRLSLPTHPLWEFTPLIDQIDVLPAKSEMIIPVIVQRKAFGGALGNELSALADPGPCTITATIEWIVLCGPFGIPYSVPIPIIHASGNCGPTPGRAGGGIGGWSGGWSGGGIGPGISQPRWNYSEPERCDCVPFEETVSITGPANFVLGPLESLLSSIKLGVIDIDDVDLKVSGEVTLEHCCDENDEHAGWGVSGAGKLGVDAELTYFFPGLGGSLPEITWHAGPWEIELELAGGLGISFEPSFYGYVSVAKECGSDQIQGCAGVEAEAPLFFGLLATAEVDLENDVTGQEFEDIGVQVRLGFQSSLKLDAKVCYDGDWTTQVCFEFAGLDLIGLVRGTFPYIDGSGQPQELEIEHSFTITLVEPGQFGDCGDGAQQAQMLESLKEALADFGLSALVAGDIPSWAPNAAPIRGADGISPSPVGETSDSGTKTSPSLGGCSTCGCGAVAAMADGDGVCATVRLQLEQEVTMTRTAFEGTLEINNRADQPIEDLQVFLSVIDVGNGVVADDRFAISPPILTNVSSMPDAGDAQVFRINPATSGSLVWTLLPTDEAAPEGPTDYTVGGFMTYVLAGRTYSVPLFPAPITVYPDAALHLKYFHQRDVFSDDPFTEEVEPSIPYDLGILVTNAGKGTARNLQIVSAQPQIIENEKGLLIDFEIVAAEINGRPSPQALTTTFGEVAPGATHQGRWQLVSSLQGHFVDYSASFQHLTGFGDSRTSLIKSVAIYELIRTVRDSRTGADTLPDFLVNEIADEEDLPDTVHLSDGTVMPVGIGSAGSFSGTPRPGSMSVTVDATMPEGWGYLRLDDPSGGAYRLAQVVRADGTEVPVDWNAWTTDRTFRLDGKRPSYEDKIHLFDYGAGTTSYTLTFRLDEGIPPEVLDVADVTPDPHPGAVASLEVLLSEEIDLASFTFADVTLRRNGGPNLINSGVSIVHVAGGTYRIDGLAELTAEEGFYELRVDGIGIADYAGNPGTGAAFDRWVNGDAPPYLLALTGVSSAARNTPLTAIDLVFSEPIDLATLDADDLTLTRDGGNDLLVGDLSLSEVTPGTYRLSGLVDLTTVAGVYVFSLDVTGIRDTAGTAGIGSESVTWHMDLSPPAIITLESVATNPRNTVLTSLDITFSETIALSSFGREDVTLRRNGTGPNLIDYRVTIEHVGVARYRITGFNWVVGYEGTYELTVNAQGILDPAGNAGTGQASTFWVMDTTPPAAPSGLRIDPDRGASNSDGRTNTATVNFGGDLSEEHLAVRLFDLTTQQDLGRVEAAGTTFAKTLTFAVSGGHRLRAQAIDRAGNFSAESFFDVFIDLTPPSVVQVSGGPAPIATESLTSLVLVFSERVLGSAFDRGHLTLTRDGGANLIDEPVTVTRLADDRFQIAGLSSLTEAVGEYRLEMDLSGLSDSAGNSGSQFVLQWRRVRPVGDLVSRVWKDLDADGRQSSDEPGLFGVLVKLYGGGSYLQETTSDADGRYRFVDLPLSQTYFLEFLAPPGYGFSPANQGPDDGLDSDADLQTGRTVSFAIQLGQNARWDAGLFRLGHVSGVVWNDLDGDQQQGDGELGLPGRAVYLDRNGNGVWDDDEPRQTTGADGRYTFPDLRPGRYVVGHELEPGWIQTYPGAAGAAGVWGGSGSGAALLNGVPFAYTVDLAVSQMRNEADFGTRLFPLAVESVLVTASGVSLTFNRPLAPAGLSLYDSETSTWGPADVTLVGTHSGPVPGSLVVDPSGHGVQFVRTGGPLVADTYTLTLRSADNAFRDLTRGLLDGDREGTPGGDFQTQFTVSQSEHVVVSFPDFSRGPGQTVDVPATRSGLPLTVSDGAGIHSISLTILYDPALLTITGAVTKPDATVTVDTSVPGEARLQFTSTTPLAAGPAEFATLTASVPATASYGAAHVLSVTQLRVNENDDWAAIADDAIHTVAYFGDTTGDRLYSGLDAQRIARVVVGLDTGFESFPLIDPVVIADMNGSGELTGIDAVLVARAVVGLDPPEIPPLPLAPQPGLAGGEGEWSGFLDEGTASLAARLFVAEADSGADDPDAIATANSGDPGSNAAPLHAGGYSQVAFNLSAGHGSTEVLALTARSAARAPEAVTLPLAPQVASAEVRFHPQPIARLSQTAVDEIFRLSDPELFDSSSDAASTDLRDVTLVKPGAAHRLTGH